MSDSAQLLEELTAFCRSGSLSEDGLRVIIERHGWAPNKPSVQNYEFFHNACHSGRVTEGILRYLLHNFPGAATFIDRNRFTPLHHICYNENVTIGMVQLLIGAFPDSVRNENIYRHMPFHPLCLNKNLFALDIMKFLLEKYPESVRHTAIDGSLPIHCAAGHQSPEFCRILIEAYPGSERITNNNGSLPFHQACQCNTVATAKYFYQLYPESINAAHRVGCSIHYAIMGIKKRKSNTEIAIDMVQFLLDCNPDVVLQKLRSKLPLYWTCYEATFDNTPTKSNVYLKILQMLYDAHPNAIESDAITSELDSFPQEIRTFINTHLTYARQARDHRLMIKTNKDGQLPLHRVLHDNVTLGSIKLLVKGNPSATRTLDDNFTLPLHIACQHHELAGVVQYLIDCDSLALEAVDRLGNTVLHYACRGAKYGTIALLLEKHGALSVSKRNANNQLPIDLLFESEVVSDRGGTEYTESIYRLIRAHPETVMFSSDATNECTSHNKKKRRRELV